MLSVAKLTEQMNKDNQKISLGMPVFNGENYIEPAIRSIMDQTYQDFELIISDNASSDRTEEICREFMNQDQRIRYYRNHSNIGAARNFNCTVMKAKGEFFKWAAHDDVLSPIYLERCLNVLENDESLVLCYPKTILMDSNGDEIGKYKVELKNVNSERPNARFRDLVLIRHWGIEIFGLMRKRVLERTNLLSTFPGSDRVFMAELSLSGKFYELPEYLFYSRDHHERSTREGTVHSRAGWWDTTKTGKTIFPHWRLYVELLRIVRDARLSNEERRLCYQHMTNWLISNLNWALLIMDLAMAIEPRSWEIMFSLRKRYSKLFDKENQNTDRNKDNLASNDQKTISGNKK